MNNKEPNRSKTNHCLYYSHDYKCEQEKETEARLNAAVNIQKCSFFI